MQISSRFTVAIHMLVCMETFKNENKITSELLASSVNSNPVIIRRILQQLKNAQLVTITRGTGGASLAKSADSISLLDVFNALGCLDNDELFHFHENPNMLCPVGRNIHLILDDKLYQIKKIMEYEMSKTTIANLLIDTKIAIEKENGFNR